MGSLMKKPIGKEFLDLLKMVPSFLKKGFFCKILRWHKHNYGIAMQNRYYNNKRVYLSRCRWCNVKIHVDSDAKLIAECGDEEDNDFDLWLKETRERSVSPETSGIAGESGAKKQS